MAYDDLVRDVVTGGGRLIVVQTINAPFGRSAEMAIGLLLARPRSAA